MRPLFSALFLLAACSAETGGLDPGDRPSERVIYADFGLGPVVAGESKTVRLELPDVDPKTIQPFDFARLGCGEAFCISALEGGGLEISFRPEEARRYAIDEELVIDGKKRSIHIDGIGIERPLRCFPSAIDFGEVDPSDCAERLVVCRNESLESIEVRADFDGEVGFDKGFIGGTIRAGDSLDFGVEFCPMSSGTAEATLRIDEVSIPLRAVTGGPRIAARPEALDFGEIARSTPSSRDLRLSGAGVQISRVFSPDPRIGIEHVDGVLWRVTLELTAEGDFDGEIVAISNDPLQPELHIPVQARVIALDGCSIEVSPATFDAGFIAGGNAQYLFFELKNVGSVDCLVGPLYNDDRNGRVRSLDPTRSARLPPGQTLTRSIEYLAPPISTEQAILRAGVSNRAAPFLEIDLRATAQDPGIEVSTREIDLGILPVICGLGQTFTINTDRRELILERIELSSPSNEFSVTGRLPSPGAPIVLAPGEVLRPRIEFRSFTDGGFARFVEIEGTIDGRRERRTVAVKAETRAEPLQIDEFEQPRSGIDYLWVIDDSCSMRGDSPLDPQEIRRFISSLESARTDYRIAVATTDTFGPVLRAGADALWVTPRSEPSPAEALIELANAGHNGSGMERGLEALERVVLEDHGFLRDGAFITMFFSDEDDHSPDTLEVAFDRIRFALGDTPWAPIAIAGPCEGDTEHASAAQRYVRFTDVIGLTPLSICGEWSRFFDRGETGRFGLRSRFQLTRSPILETLAVFVDGMPVTQVSEDGTMRWTFVSESNAIQFAPAFVPVSGSTVRIEYRASCG